MTTLDTQYARVFKQGSHTCIRINEERVYTYYIPLSTLSVQREEIREFNANWKELEVPVKEAAMKYITLTSLREMQDRARIYLAELAGISPAEAAKLRNQSTNQETTIMATAINKPAQPAAKPAAKPAAAEKKATPAAKKAAPVEPAKKGAEKKPAAPTEKVGRAAKADSTTYVVKDDSGVKRGDSRLFIDTAVELKSFSRDELVAAAVKKHGFEEERMLRYFYYFTGKGVIAPKSPA